MAGSFVIAARRSAVVPRNGAFADLSIEALATPVLHAALHDAQVAPRQVGEIIVANALGAGGNPARIIALHAGLPEHVAGLTIDRQCAGGLDALLLADAMIQSGMHDVVIAGGVESYSRRPMRYHTFADGRPPVAYDQARFTPWADQDPDMAAAADALAQDLGISKADQDAWAIDSHHKAMTAQRENRIGGLVPIAGVDHDCFARDLSPRLCDRAPVISGGITTANMSVAAAGAALTVMASRKFVADNQLGAVEFVAGATLGSTPQMPGLAPVRAIAGALEAAGLTVADVTHAEVMEAFAAQAIACQQGVEIPSAIVNPAGGSLARGHPIGASGAILAVQLFHSLQQNSGTGLAAIAAAGGLGSAAVLRR